MSSADSRLPARPSLEQLRKQAKEQLKTMRRTDPGATLSDAQYALAMSYGFESWPRLVRHVEQMVRGGPLDSFERIAADLLAGYGGDASALERLGAYFGDSGTNEARQQRVRDRLDGFVGGGRSPTLEDTRLVLARQFGFDTWADLAASLSQEPRGDDSASVSGPPFYRYDAERDTIEPQAPLTNADWDRVFAIMKERRITGIASSAFTDTAMARLSRLDFVTSVNAGGSHMLTDAGVRHLARLPRLCALELGGWHSPITDRGLEVLASLPMLERFSMGWAQRITDAGVAHLRACERLEVVNLMGTPAGDGLLEAVRGKSRLRELKTGRGVTDASLPLLHELPLLRVWQGEPVTYGLMDFESGPTRLLLDGAFTDPGLRSLAGLDGLFSLVFFRHATTFTSQGLAALAELANLGHLGCGGERCDDEAMRQIARLPNLRVLMAQGTVATDDGFVALSASRTLEHLWGRECPNLTSRGFAALRELPALQGLAVSCKYVSDDALALLPEFPSLTGLLPMDVTDDGFRHVGRCERLEKLWCMYCRSTGDAATAHIADLKLRTYYAGKTKITDTSLEILGRMASLEQLEFWECARITDHGMAALARLPRLREIAVEGSPRVTRTGMSVFGPGVRVRF